MQNLRFLFLVGACVACTTNTAESDREEPRQSDPLRERFDRLVPTLLADHRVPGLAVAVARSGELAWATGYGLADLDSRRAMTAETILNAGSISKAVTAWGVMRLVEDGKLDLDEPVASYLTSWPLRESDFDASGVTVRRLLSHTAGLTMHSIPGFQVGRELPALEAILAGDYEGSVYTDAGTPVELFAEPGTEWRYSGGGFVLLELLVEELTDRPFDEYMQEEVLEPLGMDASRFGWSEALAPVAAVPYRDDLVAFPTYRFSGAAGAGLYTSAEDLVRFAAAVLPNVESPEGRGVLSPATVAEMLRHTPLVDGSPARCGLGYFLAPAGVEPREAVHGGSNNGWQAVFVALPDDGIAIGILTNSNNAQAILSELVCAWGEIEIGRTLSGCP